CMHFVVTGRLEVWTHDRYGDRRLVAHLSSGDCVGELSLLTADTRAADVIVLRDAVLARLDRNEYDAMLRRYPDAGLNIARFALRMLREGPSFVPKVRNIVLVPLGGHVRVAEFGRRLELALLRFGSTLYLDSSVAHARRPASSSGQAQARASERHLDRLLDEAEHARRFV